MLPTNLVIGLKTGNSVLSMNEKEDVLEDNLATSTMVLMEYQHTNNNGSNRWRSFFNIKQCNSSEAKDVEPKKSTFLSCFNSC
jgi:hypothetical protein